MKTGSPLIIGGREIKNRFFLGTGKFKSKADMKKSIIDDYTAIAKNMGELCQS